MNVNLTYVLQVVNLIVTVFFVRRYLVVPVVDFILEKSERKRFLEGRVDVEKKQLEEVALQSAKEAEEFGSAFEGLREPEEVVAEVARSDVSVEMKDGVSDVRSTKDEVDDESVRRLLGELTRDFR